MEEGLSFEGPEGKVTLSGVSQGCVGVLFGKLEKSLIKFAGSNRLGGEGIPALRRPEFKCGHDKMQKCSKTIGSALAEIRAKPCAQERQRWAARMQTEERPTRQKFCWRKAGMRTDHSLNAGRAVASDNVCQAVGKEANVLGCVNRRVVWKAALSPSNIAAVSAGVAAPAWAQHPRDKGLQMETAAETVRDLTDEMCAEGVKESSDLICRIGSRG